MIDLLYSVPVHPMQPHPIRLHREFRSDLAWWQTFIVGWNGVSFLPPPRHLPAMEMASDASGSWGYGAWQGARWFQLKCDVRLYALLLPFSRDPVNIVDLLLPFSRDAVRLYALLLPFSRDPVRLYALLLP